MKLLRRYAISAIMVMLFMCVFTGVKAQAAALGQVTGLKQTDAGTGSIKVAWSPVLGADNYALEMSKDQKNWTLMEDATYGPSDYINGLGAGETYYVRVQAYTKTEKGPFSAPVECVTAPSGKPAYLRKTDSTTTTMTLSWGAVSGANAYVVKYYPSASSSKAQSVEVSGTSTTLKKLKKNTTYTVYVYGIRKNSQGTFKTEEASASYIYEWDLGVTPSKVTGVECKYYWQYLKEIEVEYDTLDSAEGYQVEVWTANKKKDTKIKSVKTTSRYSYVKANTLEKHNMIKIRVRAYTSNYKGTKKYGAWSSWSYTCPQPDITKTTRTSSGIKLTWDKISGADRYVLYGSTKKDSGYKKIKTLTKTSYTVTKVSGKNLKKGKKYYFYVVPQKKISGKYRSIEAGNSNRCWYLTY